jgi:hypothetical protein
VAPWSRLILLLAAAPSLIGGLGPRDNFDARILAAHNRERNALGVTPLRWNDELARSAGAWAGHLARTGRFEHSPDESGSEPEGENLWAGTVGYYQPESMVGLWVAEKAHFRPGVFPNNSRTGRVEAVSHYTQLMWHESREVGCALGRGRDEEVLVCRYSEAGNVIGKVPF